MAGLKDRKCLVSDDITVSVSTKDLHLRVLIDGPKGYTIEFMAYLRGQENQSILTLM